MGRKESNQTNNQTRDDKKVRGKVQLNRIAFIHCNENSLIKTTIHSKLIEIEI